MDGLDAESLARLEGMDRERRLIRWLAPVGLIAFVVLVGILVASFPDGAAETAASDSAQTAPARPAPSTSATVWAPGPAAESSPKPRRAFPLREIVSPAKKKAAPPAPKDAPARSESDLLSALKKAAAPLVVVATPFDALFGRPPSAAERAETGGLKGRALEAWFLKREELYRFWLEEELVALGLIGAYRPLAKRWEEAPAKLQRGELTATAVVRDLALTREWSAKHLGGRAFATAVLEQLLGLREGDGDWRLALRAARRVCRGQPAKFLETKASSPQALVRIASDDPRFRVSFLQRAFLRIRGKAPDDVTLDRAAEAVRQEPAAAFRVLVAWACRGGGK